MAASDVRRARVTRGAAAVLVVAAIAALAAHDVVLSRRVVALESAVAERAAADPLLPYECRASGQLTARISGRKDDEIAGRSRENPCIVQFERLLDAPQQFAGRWVEVQGRYVNGLETSALFPLDSTPPADTPWEPTGHALWVAVAPFAKPDERGGAVFIGRFRRGPAGHLAMYYASLEDR